MEKRNFIRRAFGSWVTFAVYVIAIIAFVFAMIYSTFEGAGTTVASGQKDLWYIFFLCFVGIVFSSIGIYCRLVHKLKFPGYIDIYLMLLTTMAFVGGETFGLYDILVGMDKVMHLIGGAMFVMIGASIAILFIKKEQRENSSILLIISFAFLFSISAGVIWEFLEFGVDSFFGTNAQRWQDAASTYYHQGSGLIDTMLDMLMHLVGAIPVSIFLGLCLRKDRKGEKLLITRNTK